MAAVVKQMAQMSMMDKIRTMTGLGRAAAANPAARLMAPKVGTGKRLSPKETREAAESSARKRNAAAAARSGIDRLSPVVKCQARPLDRVGLESSRRTDGSCLPRADLPILTR